MRILPSWLREFVNVAADDRQLAEDLTCAGIAVESIGEENGAIIYEMDLTTNRVDAMNHYGVAREASAIYGLELKPFEPKLSKTTAEPSTSAAKERPPLLGMTSRESFPIVIEDAEGCARYTARIIRGVKIGPSPEYIAKRLGLLGSRAINNAADATNYAINELGHPTHVFDLDLLQGGTIIVRRARDGEFLKTLDGVGRTLTSDDLVIADAEKAVALAGGTKVTSSLKGTKILRTTTDGIQEIPIPLNKILEAKAEDPALKAEDVLFIPNSPGKVAAITGAQAAISVATGLAIYRP